MTENEFDSLVEDARKVRMSPNQSERQRRSFAFGNANIEIKAVTREVVNEAADQLGRERKGPLKT